MPKGAPKQQTVATDKYQKKVGLIVKGFKIKKTLADDFVEACSRAGESQASVISRLMQRYVDEHK